MRWVQLGGAAEADAARRHSHNVDGDVVTDEMAKPQSAVSRLVLNGLQVDCNPG
jgi:hypothetical protein